MSNPYQKLDEDVLSITGSPEWESVIQLLEAEANAALQNQIDAKDWGEFKEQRGYRAGLSFVARLREITKTLIEAYDDATV